jgi:hypothetical protein
MNKIWILFEDYVGNCCYARYVMAWDHKPLREELIAEGVPELQDGYNRVELLLETGTTSYKYGDGCRDSEWYYLHEEKGQDGS